MKKMTALLLASVMTVSLAACGGNDDDDAASSGPGTQITAAEEDETEATHTIKIGVFEPLTGANAAGGEPQAKTATAASRRFWASAMPMQSCQP